MDKKSIIFIVIIIVLGILGFWAMIRFQATEINEANTSQSPIENTNR